MASPHRASVRNALLAATLFGASTPFSKLLLRGDRVSPVALAGALYLGSGCGLALWRAWSRRRVAAGQEETPLRRGDVPWLGGAILAGGGVAPVLLLFGLTPAGEADRGAAGVGQLRPNPYQSAA